MKVLHRISLLLIVFFIFTNPAAAQRRGRAATKAPAQPGPAFEDVLAADSYRIYVEIRGVGELLKTQSFNDLTEPLLKVSSPPKEFKTLLAWLNSQADSLMTSRMMVASWASRPKLPNVLIAIEFSSPEEAQKFEPRLRGFLPKVLPTPSPTPESSPNGAEPTEKKENENSRQGQVKETGPSFVIKQAGSLLYISDSSFTFKNLRPTGSRLLTEDHNFRSVHDRFSTEPVLVYVDGASMKREEEERRKKQEEERKANEAAALAASTEPQEPDSSVPSDEPPPPVAEPSEPEVASQDQIKSSQTQIDIKEQPPQTPPDIGGMLLGRIGGLMFAGPTHVPDALGVALAFEPDSYALRLFLVDEPEAKINAIPFIPQLVSGPSLTPEAASVFPADTEFFVTLSLDYQQIYEGIVKSFQEQLKQVLMRTPNPNAAYDESPFTDYEKQLGIKLKDDLIPLLGNEVALTLSFQALDVGPPKTVSEDSETPTEESPAGPATGMGPNLVIAIAIKDRDGIRALLPKIIESMGFKGASMLARTERRGDTEIVSYGDALAYAFIGNFLLISPVAKEINQTVESYLNHNTLSSVTQFRNATRWQPRQVLGQFYLSPKLMESYQDFAGRSSSLSEMLGDFLSRLSPTSEPVTYALSNEGLGPLHELRVPKNLALLMMASMFGVSPPTDPVTANEATARQMLRTIAYAQTSFKAANEGGPYGTLDELAKSGMISKEMLDSSNYRIELNVSGNRFEATAIPVEYGKTGKLSFFIDESNVLRGGDHGGGPATIADRPME